jgi:hypothetical protein
MPLASQPDEKSLLDQYPENRSLAEQASIQGGINKLTD